jgi:release factor glutamine methyltransferase
MMALDGGEDGLVFYRKIVDQASSHLRKNGVLIFEIGHDQAEEVSQLIQGTGKFTKVHVVKDLPGHDRVVYAEALY